MLKKKTKMLCFLKTVVTRRSYPYDCGRGVSSPGVRSGKIREFQQHNPGTWQKPHL